ncbi:hypothetical protein D9M68_628380 [compost metagenome]
MLIFSIYWIFPFSMDIWSFTLNLDDDNFFSLSASFYYFSQKCKLSTRSATQQIIIRPKYDKYSTTLNFTLYFFTKFNMIFTCLCIHIYQRSRQVANHILRQFGIFYTAHRKKHWMRHLSPSQKNQEICMPTKKFSALKLSEFRGNYIKQY